MAFYSEDAGWHTYSVGPDYTNHPPEVSIEGGASGGGGHAGKIGTFYAGSPPSFITETGTVIAVF